MYCAESLNTVWNGGIAIEFGIRRPWRQVEIISRAVSSITANCLVLQQSQGGDLYSERAYDHFIQSPGSRYLMDLRFLIHALFHGDIPSSSFISRLAPLRTSRLTISLLPWETASDSAVLLLACKRSGQKSSWQRSFLTMLYVFLSTPYHKVLLPAIFFWFTSTARFFTFGLSINSDPNITAVIKGE